MTATGHDALHTHLKMENQRHMTESVDVKALAAMFNTSLDPGSKEQASQRSPRPEHGRTHPNRTASQEQPHREHLPPNLRHAPYNQVVHASSHIRDMKPTGHHPLGSKFTAPSESLASTPVSRTLPVTEKHRLRNAGDVAPLRKPLPAEVSAPSKPKRPPNFKLEPFLRNLEVDRLYPRRGASEAGLRTASGGMSPPAPPQRDIKPSRRQRSSMCAEENPGGSHGNLRVTKIAEPPTDTSTLFVGTVTNPQDEDQIYEFDELEEEIRQQEERLRKENKYREIFQLCGELEVLCTTRVHHDWYDEGQLSLSVREGETVEILRVTDTPRGSWLARSISGNYGYISTACVDIDCDTLRYRMLSNRSNTSILPPPPPDPPLVAYASNRDSPFDLNDDYDDVEPILADFPPPPLDICIDPKMEKELRKKFKFEGPIVVLQTMMVDPNCIIKKPVGKQLPVSQGDVVDVIQLTNRKKVLCHNRTSGKYGYVSKQFLVPMKGGLYDGVDHPVDVYDNDLPSPQY
ncbi:FYN-binding protein 1 isoform 4-T4 [Synchiropus picturatus]